LAFSAIPWLANRCFTGLSNIRGVERNVRVYYRRPLFSTMVVMADCLVHVRERPQQEGGEHSDTSLNGKKALHPN